MSLQILRQTRKNANLNPVTTPKKGVVDQTLFKAAKKKKAFLQLGVRFSLPNLPPK